MFKITSSALLVQSGVALELKRTQPDSVVLDPSNAEPLMSEVMKGFELYMSDLEGVVSEAVLAIMPDMSKAEQQTMNEQIHQAVDDAKAVIDAPGVRNMLNKGNVQGAMSEAVKGISNMNEADKQNVIDAIQPIVGAVNAFNAMDKQEQETLRNALLSKLDGSVGPAVAKLMAMNDEQKIAFLEEQIGAFDIDDTKVLSMLKEGDLENIFAGLTASSGAPKEVEWSEHVTDVE